MNDHTNIYQEHDPFIKKLKKEFDSSIFHQPISSVYHLFNINTKKFISFSFSGLFTLEVAALLLNSKGQMDIGRNINESSIGFGSVRDVPLKQKGNMMPARTASSDNLNEGFDCNICLDAAHEPIVTLCGHLYCWPCIYKWIQVQSSSPESDDRPQCPICKACISSSTLVPLYGRGTSSSDSEVKKVKPDYKIPGRPHALGTSSPTTMASVSGQQQHQQYIPHALGNYPSMAPSSFNGKTLTSSYSPTVLMFGEIVSARFFGRECNFLSYPHPTSYPPGIISPRIRRQEMQVDKSLNRVSIFLLCCLVLCLLLF